MSGKDISIAVLGAGNIGLSLAGNSILNGFDVSLAEIPEFRVNLEAPIKAGGVEVTGELNTGFAKIDKITTNIPEAIQGRDIIVFATIAFGHEQFTRLCAPNLEDGQSLIYISYFGALRMAKLLKDLEVDKDITVAETLSAFYASDRVGKKGQFFPEEYRDDSKIVIKRWKEGLHLAAFPRSKTNKVLSKMKNIYPTMQAASNVIETSIFNVNPMGHVPGVILNTGWIEHTDGGFPFHQGSTPSVKRVGEAMSKERRALSDALGFMTQEIEQQIVNYYAKWYSTPESIKQHREKYYKDVNDAPPNLKHRYLTEDVIYGLVPMSHIADIAGIKMPTIKSMINLANIMNETNYWEEGVTLEMLGLDGMSTEEMLKFVNTGSI